MLKKIPETEYAFYMIPLIINFLNKKTKPTGLVMLKNAYLGDNTKKKGKIIDNNTVNDYLKIQGKEHS